MELAASVTLCRVVAVAAILPSTQCLLPAACRHYEYRGTTRRLHLLHTQVDVGSFGTDCVPVFTLTHCKQSCGVLIFLSPADPGSHPFHRRWVIWTGVIYPFIHVRGTGLMISGCCFCFSFLDSALSPPPPPCAVGMGRQQVVSRCDADVFGVLSSPLPPSIFPLFFDIFYFRRLRRTSQLYVLIVLTGYRYFTTVVIIIILETQHRSPGWAHCYSHTWYTNNFQLKIIRFLRGSGVPLYVCTYHRASVLAWTTCLCARKYRWCRTEGLLVHDKKSTTISYRVRTCHRADCC